MDNTPFYFWRPYPSQELESGLEPASVISQKPIEDYQDVYGEAQGHRE